MKKLMILIILMIVGIGIYVFPRKIEEDFHLVKLQYDMPEVNSSVTFHLDGYKYNSLMGSSRFVGNIIIDDTKIEQVDIQLNNLDSLVGRINEETDMSTYGAIYLDDSLQEVTILIHEEGSWSYKNGLILTGPSTSREEAIRLFEKHLTEQRVDLSTEFK